MAQVNHGVCPHQVRHLHTCNQLSVVVDQGYMTLLHDHVATLRLHYLVLLITLYLYLEIIEW